MAVLLVCALTAWGAHGAPQPAESVIAELPPGTAEELARSNFALVDSGEEGPVTALVVFERSPAEVVELLTQAARQPEYREELRRVETIENFPGGRVDEQELRILFTTLVYRLRYQVDLDEYEFDWSLDPGFDNDLSSMDGFWRLHPFDEDATRTLGRFGSRVDVGPLVPGFVQERLSRKTVLQYVQNCRAWIDSGGEWRP